MRPSKQFVWGGLNAHAGKTKTARNPVTTIVTATTKGKPMSSPTLLNAFKAALDAETDPTNPLSQAEPDSIDEFLSRINDDFAEGKFTLSTERLTQLINLYRVQAANWEMEQQAEKKRAPRGKKVDPGPALDTSTFVF